MENGLGQGMLDGIREYTMPLYQFGITVGDEELVLDKFFIDHYKDIANSVAKFSYKTNLALAISKKQYKIMNFFLYMPETYVLAGIDDLQTQSAVEAAAEHNFGLVEIIAKCRRGQKNVSRLVQDIALFYSGMFHNKGSVNTLLAHGVRMNSAVAKQIAPNKKHFSLLVNLAWWSKKNHHFCPPKLRFCVKTMLIIMKRRARKKNRLQSLMNRTSDVAFLVFSFLNMTDFVVETKRKSANSYIYL